MGTTSNPATGAQARPGVGPQSARTEKPAHTIRPFASGDIPEIIDLHHRVMSPGEPAPAAFFEERFLSHPWYDASMPSWVYADAEDKITGFIGVLPRPFLLGNRTVTAAFTTKFIVAPDARASQAAMLLFRKFIEGPQQISYADITNQRSVLFWNAFGGQSVPVYDFEWRRSLRRCPSLRMKSRKGVLGKLARACRPVLDNTAQRLRPAPELRKPDVSIDPLDPEEAVAAMPGLLGPNVLRPQYDADSLRWVMARFDEAPDGELHSAAVRSNGNLLGWFVYLIDVGRQAAEVIQVVADKRRRETVLDAMLCHAADHGATDMFGRTESSWLPLLSARPDVTCEFRGYSLMVRTSDIELSERILRGDILISPLEGERLTQFYHER